jgi:hypothetical protein
MKQHFGCNKHGPAYVWWPTSFTEHEAKFNKKLSTAHNNYVQALAAYHGICMYVYMYGRLQARAVFTNGGVHGCV